LTPALRTALQLLLQAYQTATALDQDQWDFALEIQQLKEVGLSHNDLRSLVFQGFAEHLLERTPPGAKGRSFQQPRGLRLQANSCFVLAQAGLLLGLELSAADDPLRLPPPPWNGAPGTGALPVWDHDRRELRLGEALVKLYRQPARNQERILAAFQEDGWPPRIDNPLSGSAEVSALDRLHEAVKKLNRQRRRLLRFRSDGNGLGVQWEFADPGGAQARPLIRRASSD
jgi:hypothetical protein